MSKLSKRFDKWWQARYFPWLLAGIPAVLLAGAVGVAWIYRSEWSPLTVHDRYAAAKRDAMALGDWARGRIACERLLDVARTDAFLAKRYPEHLYDLGRCLVGLGRVEDGKHLINKVAPEDGEAALSYPQAHLDIAKELWGDEKERTPERLARVERHLLRAATDDPGMAEAHQQLGELYISRRDWDGARKHLLKAVDKRGECLLLLAYVSQGAGDKEAERQWATRALAYFQQRLDGAVQEDIVARIGLARTHVLLGQFEEAVESFVIGYKRTANPGYRAAIAAVYASWIETLRKSAQPDLKAILAHVRSGLEFEPRNQVLLRELVALSESGGDAGKEAESTVRAMLAEGGDTSLLHFSLGSAALRRNDETTARGHFDLAFKQSPELPQIANNMAMAIASGPGGDLDRALQIVNEVLKRYPDLAAVRDTRGHILLAMKRYFEAVADFEFALPRLGPMAAPTHKALAEAYTAMNLPDLAEEHRRRAARLEAAVPEPGRK